MTIIKNDYIKINKFTRPGNKLTGVKGIVIHWTANPGASASNHQKYFNNGAGGRYASAHIFVDGKEVLCIIPLNEVAYAANETGKSKIAKFNGNFGYPGGNANGCTISVEMCVEKNGTISKVVENKTVEVVAELCKKYGLTEKDVYRHYDVTGKSCPTPFIGGSRFTTFKSKVKNKLDGPSTIKKPVVVDKPKSIGTIKTLVDNLNYYKKPSWVNAAGTVKKNTVLTVVSKVFVDGAYQYKTVSGTYITASSKYVKFTTK